MTAIGVKPEQRTGDPVMLEIMAGAFKSIADEIGYVLERTAYSNVIVDARDLSTAVLDPTGRLIAEGENVPLHVGVMAETMPFIFDAIGGPGALAEGDIILSNDPFRGGTHLPDVMLFSPVFANGTLVAFAANLAHWADVGGRVLGGMSCDATESYQEGLRFSPLKLYDRGQLNQTLIHIVKDNVRLPDEVVGDLMAQVSGCLVGNRRVVELISKYGQEHVAEYMSLLLDYSERLMRERIQRIPDGSYEAEDFLDNDGITAEPVRISVRVTVSEDELTADFSGSALQTEGPFNSTINGTKAVVYAMLISLAPHIPANAGCYRCIHVVAPAGTVTNAMAPAATGPRAATSMRIADTLLAALAKALPDQIPAAADGNLLGSRIYGYGPDRRYFGFNDGVIGGTGGRPIGDGADGMCFGITNTRNRTIEDLENRFPVLFECYEYRQDTGGAGQFRGGLGLRRFVRILRQARLTVRNERQIFAPYGLWGGGSGSRGLVAVNGAPIHAKATNFPLSAGDRFEMQTPGGGGWGNPSRRDPAAIERDLADEKISLAHAQSEYGYSVADMKAGESKSRPRPLGTPE
jgi:N-methylhydantoinase B